MMTDGVGAVWVRDALCGTSAPGRCPSLWLKRPLGAVQHRAELGEDLTPGPSPWKGEGRQMADEYSESCMIVLFIHYSPVPVQSALFLMRICGVR